MAGTASRITIRQLEYFVAVAESGTLAAAAAEHHISQSAISLAVSDLEKILGVQLLLRRKARGVALTGAAQRILPELRSVLAHVGEVHSTARSLGQEISGDLTLGCYPTLTPFVVPQILNGFPLAYPSVNIDLFEGSVSQMQARLLDGSCELALMYNLGISSDVATTVLYSVRPYVVLPPDHHLATAGPIRLAELEREPMVMLDMPPSMDLFREILAGAGVEPWVRFKTVSFESVRSLVASHAGYSIMLQRPAPDATYAGPPVHCREIADEVRQVDVVLAQARSARLTRRARALADFCQAGLGRGP